jgi:Cytochrome c
MRLCSSNQNIDPDHPIWHCACISLATKEVFMRFRTAAFLICAVTVFVQMNAQTTTTIRHVPLTPTSAASGKEMFESYCAACHGVDGTGNGPASPALKPPPANLTRLGAKEGGKFPEERVFGILSGTVEVTAHGSSDMPMWGNLLKNLTHGDLKTANLRAKNLTDYIKSIQVK